MRLTNLLFVHTVRRSAAFHSWTVLSLPPVINVWKLGWVASPRRPWQWPLEKWNKKFSWNWQLISLYATKESDEASDSLRELSRVITNRPQRSFWKGNISIFFSRSFPYNPPLMNIPSINRLIWLDSGIRFTTVRFWRASSQKIESVLSFK